MTRRWFHRKLTVHLKTSGSNVARVAEFAPDTPPASLHPRSDILGGKDVRSGVASECPQSVALDDALPPSASKTPSEAGDIPPQTPRVHIEEAGSRPVTPTPPSSGDRPGQGKGKGRRGKSKKGQKGGWLAEMQQYRGYHMPYPQQWIPHMWTGW